MITYCILKIFENALFDFVILPLSMGLIVFIGVCIYGYSKGHRPTKQGLYNGLDRLTREWMDKCDRDKAFHEYYKAHKPYPWSTWRD